jgi:hypothetical protein
MDAVVIPSNVTVKPLLAFFNDAGNLREAIILCLKDSAVGQPIASGPTRGELKMGRLVRRVAAVNKARFFNNDKPPES